MGNRYIRTAAGSLLMVLAAPAVVGAEAVSTPSPIHDRFAIRASYFSGAVSTDARVDDTAAGNIGTEFSFEDDFGLPDSDSQWRGEITIRLRERGKLRVDMFTLAREGAAVMTRNIDFGDETFAAGENVNSSFDWSALNFTWTYSLLHNDRYEAGIGAGLHLIEAATSATIPARGVRESFDGSGPFVTLAFDGVWRISPRFAFSARAQWLELAVSDITGTLADYHADVQFRWRPNLAFGLGYQGNRMRLDVPEENPGGLMKFKVSGFELFLRASL